MFDKTLLYKFLTKSPKDYWAKVSINRRQIAPLIQANTPIFIINRLIVTDRLAQLDQSLKRNIPQKTRILYSCKTNYQLLKTDILHQLQVGAEVVSGWEYDLAISQGFSPRDIIFNGPIKTNNEIVRALKAGATVHLDTHNQVDQIVSLSKQWNAAQWPGKLGIRLKTDPHSRFGYDIDSGEAHQVLIRLKTRKIPLRSFHHHPGTDIYSTKHRYYHAKKITEWINGNFTHFQTRAVSLDVGGGFPAHGLYPYHHRPSKDDSVDINDHIAAISRGIGSCATIDEVIMEPGRWVIEDGTMYVAKVIDVQQTSGGQRILINGAITQLAVTYYRPQIVNIYSNSLILKSVKNVHTLIYGATCKEDDKLFEGPLPIAKKGDFAIFFAVGAYNQSMQSEFIYAPAQSVLQ